MKSSWIKILSVLIGMNVLGACKTLDQSESASKAARSTSFVKIVDGQFVLDEEPFYFVGSNFYRLALSDAFGKSIKTEQKNGVTEYPQIDRVMQNYAQENIRVVRMWGFSCERPGESHLDPPLIYSNFEYSPQALQQLDFTIAAAARHGIKIILTTVNFEPEYCGMTWWVGQSFARASAEDQKRLLYSCYSSNHSDHTVYKVARTEQGCKDLGYEAKPLRELFYTDPLVKNRYKEHLKFMLNRKNPYTGRAYKDEPAIFAVEVANEPHTSDFMECMLSDVDLKNHKDCQKEGMINYQSGKLVSEWLREITSYVKSIDANHLVSSGEEGYRREHQDKDCREPHNWLHNGSKGVDFCC